jgi:hypothetical protein
MDEIIRLIEYCDESAARNNKLADGCTAVASAEWFRGRASVFTNMSALLKNVNERLYNSLTV